MKALPVIILSILLLLNQGYMENIDSNTNEMNNLIDSQQLKNFSTHAVTTVIHDGLISEGEYNYSVLIDSTSNFHLYYSVNASVVYFAMVADVLGYISIGFNYSSQMQDSDIVFGNYTDKAYIKDSWGVSRFSFKADDTQNILSFAGSENITSTIIEFSRNLDTGDALEDFILPLDTKIEIIWAVHETSDGFTAGHTGRGFSTLTLKTSDYPNQPTDVNLSIVGDHILVNWIAPSDTSITIDNYNIYRSVMSGSNFALVGTSITNSYQDTGFVKSSGNFYMVSAKNVWGESVNSTEVSVIVPIDPVTPTEFKAVGGDSKITLSWTDSINGADLIHYRIYRSPTSSGVFVNFINSTDTSYIDTDVQAGETWFYKISSVNVLGESVLSSSIIATVDEVSTSVTTTNQTTDPESSILPYFAIAGAIIAIVATLIILRKLNK